MSAKTMPGFISVYVRWVDAVNRVLGSVVMYLTLAMMALLLFGSLTRYVFNVPFVWIIEMAQFLMAAYYILGGGYSMQLDAHVRMDVLYERWRPRTRSLVDSITAFFLVFYLAIMVYGGFSSSAYSLKYNQTNYSAWAPPMAPIKIIMTVGLALMLLQAIAIFFRDIARITGREIA
jgi:TRAP-type mannitol/chloroaromatic compound transport system permease small subunit